MGHHMPLTLALLMDYFCVDGSFMHVIECTCHSVQLILSVCPFSLISTATNNLSVKLFLNDNKYQLYRCTICESWGSYQTVSVSHSWFGTRKVIDTSRLYIYCVNRLGKHVKSDTISLLIFRTWKWWPGCVKFTLDISWPNVPANGDHVERVWKLEHTQQKSSFCLVVDCWTNNWTGKSAPSRAPYTTMHYSPVLIVKIHVLSMNNANIKKRDSSICKFDCKTNVFLSSSFQKLQSE